MNATAELKEIAQAEVEARKDQLIGVSQEIHRNPELAMQEFKAAKLLTELLEHEGFTVTSGIAGLPTAFVAEYRAGKGRTIGILAEYDALPGMGHACGHNIIGSSSVGAGLAVKRLLADGKLSGAIRVYGTPAEEGGGGKILMAQAGAFEDCDAALAMHASQHDTVGGSCLASTRFSFRFKGRPAHSAAAPHEGLNALDAVIGTFNAVNALRQHVKPDVRIHGIITNGGAAVNIVPELAECRIGVRSASTQYLTEVAEKVKNCARGAALQTGTTLAIEEGMQYDDLLECQPLSLLMKANMEQLGLQVADRHGSVTPASTDVGNVSQLIPTAQGHFAICPANVPTHSDGFCQASASPAGDKAVLDAAKAMAMTAIDLMHCDQTVAEVKAAFAAEKTARK